MASLLQPSFKFKKKNKIAIAASKKSAMTALDQEGGAAVESQALYTIRLQALGLLYATFKHLKLPSPFTHPSTFLCRQFRSANSAVEAQL